MICLFQIKKTCTNIELAIRFIGKIILSFNLISFTSLTFGYNAGDLTLSIPNSRVSSTLNTCMYVSIFPEI